MYLATNLPILHAPMSIAGRPPAGKEALTNVMAAWDDQISLLQAENSVPLSATSADASIWRPTERACVDESRSTVATSVRRRLQNHCVRVQLLCGSAVPLLV